MAGIWLGLEARRRWRSLVVLALLVALTTGTVLAAVAGARREDSAFGRLWGRTSPATVTVLANQPAFDWPKAAALPEVSALGTLLVYYGASDGYPGSTLGFPPGNAALMQTVEQPVVLQGRLADPGRADEVVVSPYYLTAHHLRLGDQLTLHLSSPAQATAGFNAATDGTPLGPRVTVRVVGVIRSPFFMDKPGDSAGAFLPGVARLLL